MSELALQKVTKCQDCIPSKPIQKATITPLLQQTYNPCNGTEDTLEINWVGDLPPANSFTQLPTQQKLDNKIWKRSFQRIHVGRINEAKSDQSNFAETETDNGIIFYKGTSILNTTEPYP